MKRRANSLKRQSLAVLFLIVATELVGFGLVIPVLPQIAVNFDVSGFSIGILMGSYSFAQFLAAPLLGYLSDIYGRRPVLLLSKLGTVIAYFIMGHSSGFLGLLFARLLDGATGGNISVARAYIVDITDEKNRSKGMAVIGMAFGFGFIVGPAIGGFLYRDGSHVLSSYVAMCMSALAFVLTLLLLEEPEKKRINRRRKRLSFFASGIPKSKVIGSIFLAYFMYMFIFSGFETTFSFYTKYVFDMTLRNNSWLFTYIGFLSLIFQGTLARRPFKYPNRIVVIGFILYALGTLFMIVSPNFIWICISLPVFVLGVSLINSFLPTLLSFYAKDTNKGVLMGVYESIGSLCRILGPIITYVLFWFPESNPVIVYKSVYFVYAGIALLGAFVISFFIPIFSKAKKNKIYAISEPNPDSSENHA